MTIQSIGRSNGPTAHSPEAVLNRIDAILHELQELRHIVEISVADSPQADFVAELAGSLGPGSVTELDEFNTFDISWQRFVE